MDFAEVERGGGNGGESCHADRRVLEEPRGRIADAGQGESARSTDRRQSVEQAPSVGQADEGAADGDPYHGQVFTAATTGERAGATSGATGDGSNAASAATDPAASR